MHLHKYKAVSLDHYQLTETWGSEQTFKGVVTDVLYRCQRCEKVKTEQFKGNWELKHFV